MDTAPRSADNSGLASSETENARQDRLAQEADHIAEARAELDAGLYVDADDIDIWIDSLATDHALPLPATRRH